MSIGVCRSCGAQVRWCVTANGKNMPIDATPVSVFRIVTDLEGIDRLEHVSDRVYQSHFATCPNAEQHRRGRS